MNNPSQPIYHLTSANYYYQQPQEKPYLSQMFAQEGFIHCTAGQEMLIEVANRYFGTFAGDLLALRIDPKHLTSPLKFEAPVPPPGEPSAESHTQYDVLFPHIYGALNREAIADCVALQRDEAGRWFFPAQ